MSSYLKTAANDRIAFDRRGDGPAVIFVAGAGPWREIDSGTTQTAELLAEMGHTTAVYDRVGRGESAAEASPLTASSPRSAPFSARRADAVFSAVIPRDAPSHCSPRLADFP